MMEPFEKQLRAIIMFASYNPANTLCRSNLIISLYFNNLRKFSLLTLIARNLDYVRNSDDAIMLV